jgi:beta-phosphoglucomutase
MKRGFKKSKKSYKAIIFDLDGTLINSLPYHFLAFKDMLLEHGLRIDNNRLKKLIGLSTRLILKELKKTYKFKEKIEDLREERRYHYFKFLGRRNIAFPGVKNKLAKLRLEYKLAIATGSSSVLVSHSADKDFQELFDIIVTINDVKSERGKPYPDQLLLAARKMKVKPCECLMIGDSIYDGIAAKRAKIDFIGVLSGYNSEKELKNIGAIKVIKSINDLEL